MDGCKHQDPRNYAPVVKSSPGLGDDIPCVKCKSPLDTGLECTECGFDNYEAVTGRPFAQAPRGPAMSAPVCPMCKGDKFHETRLGEWEPCDLCDGTSVVERRVALLEELADLKTRVAEVKYCVWRKEVVMAGTFAFAGCCGESTTGRDAKSFAFCPYCGLPISLEQS